MLEVVPGCWVQVLGLTCSNLFEEPAQNPRRAPHIHTSKEGHSEQGQAGRVGMKIAQYPY